MLAPSVEKIKKNTIICAYLIDVVNQLDRKVFNIFERATCLIMSKSIKGTLYLKEG